MKHPEVSCFVPTYNEEKTIVATLGRLHECMSSIVSDFELVVVDDHSQDRTVSVARSMTHTEIRVITNKRGPSFRENLGRAMCEAPAPIAVFCDADYVPEVATLRALLACFEDGADLAIGSRYHPESRVKRGAFRWTISKLYNHLMRVLYQSKFPDHQCGLKAFRTETLRRLCREMSPDPDFSRRWFWDAELLVRAQCADLTISQIPVSWPCRPDSRAMILKQYSMLPWMIRLWRETRFPTSRSGGIERGERKTY